MGERSRGDSPTKHCTVDGCGRAHRARGLCVTHYNQQRQTPEQRHPKVTVSCGYCGEPCVKGKTTRFAARFCSWICRDLWRVETGNNPEPSIKGGGKSGPRGPRSCRVPPTHPARWFGDTCPIEYRACAWCGQTYICRAGHHSRSYCSRWCKVHAKRCRRRTTESLSGIGVWRWSDFMRMAARFQFRCAYCEQKPDRLDPDHVLPLSRGGANVLANLLPACLPCNSDKRDLTLTEWEADRARRGLPPRVTSWPPEDRRYMQLTCIDEAA